MGFGIPSFSDIRNAVTNTVSSAASGVSGAAASVRDFGSAAVERTKQLASDGVDLGRRAVNAVRSVDVREAAAVVRQKIGEGTEAAREGIRTGVEYAGQRTGDAADFARAHVPGGDNVVSNGIRGAITVAESSTRFQLGVVGGVSREVVGLAGTVGQLGTTAVEMRLSPEASAEYGQKIIDGATGAVEATGNYIESAANDPSRIGRDLSSAADVGGQWVDGQVNRYEQAFRDGKGFETVGMDVGTVATYVVPVGGGPARGALTAATRGGAEAAARGGVEAVAREGAEALARGGAASGARSLTEITASLRATTRNELDTLRTANVSNRQIGPAISTVMDSRTGVTSRTYVNATGNTLPPNLHPAIANRLEAAMETGYMKTHGAGTHSEVYAVNEMLNNGSRLEDLVVYTEGTKGDLAGTVKPPCPHCSVLLAGVTYAK